jgi:hypothetical protein
MLFLQSIESDHDFRAFDSAPVVDHKTAVNGDNETFKKFFHSYYRKELYCAIGL